VCKLLDQLDAGVPSSFWNSTKLGFSGGKLELGLRQVATEAIIDEMDSIKGNNTWVLADQPPGFKWIFKSKMKVDGTIRNFKARLVIHGFKKGHGEADDILSIRIKHESNGVLISQSHYIERTLKKFNYFDCTIVSTPMDISDKLKPNNDKAVS
ncbi:hypothetical protein Tco_1282525, partial [Tanacetum coccineum]